VAEGREAANILLLDAFILVLVLYRASAPAELPFPPPQDSLLWRAITEIKTVRVCGCPRAEIAAALLSVCVTVGRQHSLLSAVASCAAIH
jgi:hypothetical protein